MKVLTASDPLRRTISHCRDNWLRTFVCAHKDTLMKVAWGFVILCLVVAL